MNNKDKIIFADFSKNKELKEKEELNNSFKNFSFNHSNPIKTRLAKFVHTEIKNKNDDYTSSFRPEDLF
ncbi:MAG: hypothetical protein WCK67_04120 [bacterium]